MRIRRKQRPAGLPGGASMAGREGIPLRSQEKAARHCMERTFRQGAAEEKSKIKQREMKRIATSVLGMLAMTAMLRAQIDFGGTPPSFRQGGAKAVSSVPVQKVEHHLDEVSLMEEEAEARLLGLPPRVAMNVAVDYSPATAGIWRSLPDGRPVWQLGLELPGAKAILVSYADFYLPEGVELYLYNPTKTAVLGSYRTATHPQGGSFSTRMLPGDAVIFELVLPKGLDEAAQKELKEQIRLDISGLGYCYNGISVHHLPGMAAMQEASNAPKYGESEWCTININCEEGEDWQVAKKSVTQMMMLVNNGWYVCTGTLLNNTAQNIRPFIASAWHCLSDGDPETIDFAQWQFTFDYESPGCENAEPLDAKTMVGCVYRASTPMKGGSDGLLLELTQEIPEEWGVWYSGWDRRNILPADSVLTNIHHPAGDIKKISVLKDLMVDQWPMEDKVGDTNAHIRVVYDSTQNGRSITEGGSSGSGAFNSDYRLVATLTGGNASCDYPDGYGYYGRLWYHWDQYGTDSTTQFAYWLDPLKTGQETIDGIYIDPNAPRVDLSREELPVFWPDDYTQPSEADTVSVKTANLTEPVRIWTTEPFEVSGNGTDFALESEREGDGLVYVRYNPQGIRRDTAFVYLCSSGSDTAKVYVIGNSCQPLTLEPEILEYAYVDASYSQQLQASGSDAEYTYEITEGRLPEGLALSPDGLISGTPVEFGLFPLTIRVSEPQLCDQFFARSLYVVCDVVDQFPFEEGFEEGLIPSCWTQEYVKDSVDWQFVAGVDNPEASITGAYEGGYNALFKAGSYEGWTTKLVTPQLDLSGLQNPVLSFAYAQPVWVTDQDQLKVYVKNAATADWTELLSFEGDMPQWQDTTVALPDPSNEYFVAFEGISHFGHGVVVDAVRIEQGEALPPSAAETSEPFRFRYNNPVDDLLRIEWEGRSVESMAVYDVMGRLVYRTSIGSGENSVEIPAGNWNPGLYSIEMTAGNQIENIKIIKR